MRHQRIKPNQRARTAHAVAIRWGLRSIFPSLVALLVGAAIFAAVYPMRNGKEQPLILPGGDRELLLLDPTNVAPPPPSILPGGDRELLLLDRANMAPPPPSILPGGDRELLLLDRANMAPPWSVNLSLCNVFSGRWVHDKASRPLYKEGKLTCRKHGRKNLKYQQWRWQPHGCDLPRFDATVLLERLRNKRLMFVGDSINRGQWVSLVSMIKSWIPKKRRSHRSRRPGIPFIVFNALDYNATIEFYWAPLLVESNCDHPRNHRIDNRIVRVRTIEKHARHWSDVDILVFNSYLWWRQGPKINVSWGSFASPDGKYEMVKMPRAYKIALKTWSDWIQVHVNRSKTQVFFVGMSPTHERAEDWGGIAGRNCFGETEPITKEGYGGSGTNRGMMHVLQKAIDKLRKRGFNTHVLNITQLSEYRKDAHSSIHKPQFRKLTRHQIANPATYADCFHWCLPGLPDVWNELLYAYILQN